VDLLNTVKRSEDDSSNDHSREDRFFSLDDLWYFTTREGVVMGPYDSAGEAQRELNSYIDFVKSANPPVLNLVKRSKMTIDPE
jgi:hypothetical protein